MQYFIWMKGASSEKQRVYEILTAEKGRRGYDLCEQPMSEFDVTEFKRHFGKFNKVLRTGDGAVYEFKHAESFKYFYDALKEQTRKTK